MDDASRPPTATEGLELLAISRGLAAQSHELNNVLAIIGEAAGLAEDLLDMAAADPEKAAAALERAAKSLGSIQKQVARGHGLATDLNQLAHLPDNRAEHPGALVSREMDMAALAALAARFMTRPASQAQIAIAVVTAGPLPAQGDPAAVQAALLAMLRWLLTVCAAGETLELTDDQAPGLTVRTAAPLPPPHEAPAETAALLARAGLVLRADNGRLLVTTQGASR